MLRLSISTGGRVKQRSTGGELDHPCAGSRLPSLASLGLSMAMPGHSLVAMQSLGHIPDMLCLLFWVEEAAGVFQRADVTAFRCHIIHMELSHWGSSHGGGPHCYIEVPTGMPVLQQPGELLPVTACLPALRCSLPKLVSLTCSRGRTTLSTGSCRHPPRLH